ncbi:MAG: M20 family metallopeptidase [Anaerolineae bacterium]
MQLLEQARQMEDQLVAWRREIHMHPELGFEETRTARLVADTLRSMGIETEVGVGITGVVARIGDGSAGPRIGIRADMDALPLDEANDVPYKSQTPGVMHACGHDAHTAILMGVAKLLNEMPDRPAGEIRLLFQPSEERWDKELKSGATRMIEDKALEGLDAVIALHVASDSPSGQVEVGPGYVLAAVDSFHATIHGIGCHGAMPHTGIDPIFISAQVINAIQGIRSRRLDPTRGSVVTIGSIHGGTADNIIPASVKFGGTIRSFDEETRSKIHEELDRAFSLARTLGGDYELTIERGYPALYNDPTITENLRTVATEAIGEGQVIQGTPMMGAEDFAYMAQAAPGAMFMLGAKLDDMHRPHHSPIFDIDEKAMPVGAAVLAETAVRLLRERA